MSDHSLHGAQAVERSNTAPASRFKADMDTGMARMMQDMHGSNYTGNPDKDFLSMMIPHHEGAVDMARVVLIHGRDPLVRQIPAQALM